MSVSLSAHEVSYPEVSRPSNLAQLAGWVGIAFVALHVPLALGMKAYPQLATLHALITLVVGLRWAVSKGCLRQVACVGAYITGSEVLWRMNEASIFWEYGKYATGLVLIVALVRNRLIKMPLLPVLYFALLIPGIVPTVMQDYLNLDRIRDYLSFNLSGPFALLVSAWFFSHLKVTWSEFEHILISFLAPIIGLASITLFGILTADSISWGSHSMFITSGGYGPNQVSAILGLGALVALLFLLKSRENFLIKLLMFLAMISLAAQSALTFSRGGLYGAGGGAIAAIACLSRDRQARLRILFFGGLTLVVAIFVVLPRLNDLTGGALTARFENTSTTGRTEIAESDLKFWDENPIVGVGVGMSFYRDFGWKSAHTEFTRMLAEHGSFGFVAILLLLIAGLRQLTLPQRPRRRAVVAAMLVWSVLFMAAMAMRLVAPSFTFGLAFIGLTSDHPPVVLSPAAYRQYLAYLASLTRFRQEKLKEKLSPTV